MRVGEGRKGERERKKEEEEGREGARERRMEGRKGRKEREGKIER